MTQEQKDLLLKDLCARLPYNPLVEYKGESYNVLGIAHGRLVLCKPFMSYTLNENPLVEEVKHYLFPLSGMTEEHIFEINDILGKDFEIDKYGITDLIRNRRTCLSYLELDALFEYFNKNHFDYRCLIPMNLANDATGLNIY